MNKNISDFYSSLIKMYRVFLVISFSLFYSDMSKKKKEKILYYFCQFSVSRQYSNNKNLAYDYVAKIICNVEHWILFLYSKSLMLGYVFF
jgi:hypothetical protein